MSQVLYALPSYVEEIIFRLIEKNWLVHNFITTDKSEVYNPSNFLHNGEVDNTKYVLVVDLNIYQFLLNIVKKLEPKEHFRDAASLLVFCQVSNIEIDPTFSVYEKLNYEEANMNDALEDLELFHNINNADMEDLSKYALGYVDSIRVKKVRSIDYKKVGSDLLRYEKLKEWDSLYLILLSITDISNDLSIPRNRKLEVFIDWIIYEFRMSLVGIVYAIVLFGKNPIKRMMKYNKLHSVDKRRRAIINMTWDLYVMKQFFIKWTAKEENEEYVFASDDKAFCSLLRKAVEVQKASSFKSMESLLSTFDYDNVNRTLELNKTTEGRVYNTDEWGPEYRSKLISKYELKLFGCSEN